MKGFLFLSLISWRPICEFRIIQGVMSPEFGISGPVLYCISFAFRSQMSQDSVGVRAGNWTRNLQCDVMGMTVRERSYSYS